MKRIAFAVAAAWALCFGAHADEYPSKPIKIIVPYPGGQASDTITRLVGDRLGKALGQPVDVAKVQEKLRALGMPLHGEEVKGTM